MRAKNSLFGLVGHVVEWNRSLRGNRWRRVYALLKATLAEIAASIVDLRTNVDGWGKAPLRGPSATRAPGR